MTREEAIEIVRNIYQTDAEKEALQSLIPELAESNDEKIRKSLLEFLDNVWHMGKNADFDRFGKADCADWISYIEKQKEQIVIKQNIIDSIRANTQPDWDFSTIPNLREEINRFFGKKFVLPHTEDTIITVSDVIRCAYHFYKFGKQEQKPAEKLSKEEYVKKFKALCDAYEIKLPNREYDIYGLCEDLHKLFGDIQKPAEWSEEEKERIRQNGRLDVCYDPEKYGLCHKIEWNEEDKVMLNNIIWGVHMKSIKPLDEMDDRSKYEKYEDFLKALPERFNLQPKQEWSEQDEQTFINSVDTLEYLGKFELANWLKDHKSQFLKPQNTWKPSEEEIGALAEAMERNDKIGYLLHQLHEELKHNYKL